MSNHELSSARNCTEGLSFASNSEYVIHFLTKRKVIYNIQNMEGFDNVYEKFENGEGYVLGAIQIIRYTFLALF